MPQRCCPPKMRVAAGQCAIAGLCTAARSCAVGCHSAAPRLPAVTAPLLGCASALSGRPLQVCAPSPSCEPSPHNAPPHAIAVAMACAQPAGHVLVQGASTRNAGAIALRKWTALTGVSRTCAVVVRHRPRRPQLLCAKLLLVQVCGPERWLCQVRA